MLEYPILVIDLHKRIDRNRKLDVKLLRELSLPCWQGRYTMRGNMLNDGWWLIDIETTGLDVWKDHIIAIRYTQMADYAVRGETTLYICQPKPEGISELTGITDDMLARGISLEEAVSELEALPCGDTPFVFTGEDFTAGFLNAAFLRRSKAFDHPYLAIDKLANIPFGYLMQRRARNIPSLIAPELTENERQIENLEQFIQRVHKYEDLQELTPYALRELVKAIYIEAPDKSSGKRRQGIRISYDLVGFIPVEELLKQETA